MKTTKLGIQIKSLAEQFEAESWLPFEKIQAMQFEKLERLAGYCEKQSPFLAKRLKESGLTPSTLATSEGLKKFPLLTRRDLQSSINELYCKCPPKAHMPLAEVSTSGSSGEPVIVRRTAANQVYLLTFTLLEHQWHQRDPLGRSAVIRANVNSFVKNENWGQPLNLLFETGPAIAMPITTDVKTLVKWLSDFQPNYLLIYPNTLAAITAHCQAHNLKLPAIKQIRTISETLSLSVRQQAEDYFDCKIHDVYSSQELGVIALECPISGLYHCASPNLIVEVLNAAGEQCQAGEIGRIIVTDLHNFATPLVRYDIRDYAEVGPPCPCGRGWPTLSRIMGRERNLIHMPDGSRHWPTVGFAQFREIAPVVQYQVIQHEIERLEVRLVTSRPLIPDEVSQLREHIQFSLGYPFAIDFNYFEYRLPIGKNGKFEEFMNAIPR